MTSMDAATVAEKGNQWRAMVAKVAALESENAALWAFVKAHDDELYATEQYRALSRDHEPDEVEEITTAFLDAPTRRRAARAALAQFEEAT